MRRMGMRRRVVICGIRVGREARIWSLIRMRIEILVSALILKRKNDAEFGRSAYVDVSPQIIGVWDFEFWELELLIKIFWSKGVSSAR
jgi:hypothetical protein